MPQKKRTMIDDETTVTKQSKKPKQHATDDSESTPTKRGGRSKNFRAPNTTASSRGTQSAKVQGKRLSKQKVVTEVLISEPIKADQERVVFIDNDTGEPKFALCRTTEKGEPMAHIWTQFLQSCQSARDHIGGDVLGSFLSEEEVKAISLSNNANIFPTLITSKGALRSKDNLEASTNNAQRNAGGTFGSGAATVTGANVLRSRASNLRKKAQALLKQANAYDTAADAMGESDPAPEEDESAKHGMSFIGEVLSLNRREFNKYVNDHEDHLTATAEKLRSEMANLASYVHRAEKRLRDLIQLKVAADMKLCRDIKQFGQFEMKVWQMEALPHNGHTCWCNRCTGGVDDGVVDSRVPLRYPSSGLPQRRREEASPKVKLEEESGDEEDLGDGGLKDLCSQARTRRNPTANDYTADSRTPPTATTPAADNYPSGDCTSDNTTVANSPAAADAPVIASDNNDESRFSSPEASVEAA